MSLHRKPHTQSACVLRWRCCCVQQTGRQATPLDWFWMAALGSVLFSAICHHLSENSIFFSSVKYLVFPMVCAACMHGVCILLWMVHVLSCYCACSPLTSLLFYCCCMKSASFFLLFLMYFLYCVCVCFCVWLCVYVCVCDCVCVWVLLYVFPMQHSFMYYS